MEVVVATAGSLLLLAGADGAPQPSNKLGSGTTGGTGTAAVAVGAGALPATTAVLTCIPPNMDPPPFVAAVTGVGVAT